MRTAFIATALAATLGVTSAVLPTPWLGTWNGTIGVTYGQADPTAPDSVECFNGNPPAYRAVQLVLNADGTGSFSTIPEQTYGLYTLSEVPGFLFVNAWFNDNILALAETPTLSRCFWAKLSGANLTLLLLGDTAEAQCTAGGATYNIGPTYQTAPICNTDAVDYPFTPTTSTAYLAFTNAALATPSPAATRTSTPTPVRPRPNGADGVVLSFSAALVSSAAALVAALFL